MNINVRLPDDKESQRRATELRAKYNSLQATVDRENLPFTVGTLSDIINGRFYNVSVDNMNAFRSAVGMDPLPKAKLVLEDVNQKARKIAATPRPKRVRKPRLSLPTDPVEAALYLADRTSTAWRQALVDELEETIHEGVKLTGENDD